MLEVTSLNRQKRARVKARLGFLDRHLSDKIYTAVDPRAEMNRNVQLSKSEVSDNFLHHWDSSYTVCISASESKAVYRSAAYSSFRPGFSRDWNLQVVVKW